MKSKAIFKLSIRLLGLVFLYHGLQTVPAAGALFLNAFPHNLGPHVHEPMNFSRLYAAMFMVGWPLLLAYWLIRGAPLVMRLAYPEEAVSQPNVGAGVGEKADA